MTTKQERLKNAVLALGALQVSDLGGADLATTRAALDVIHKEADSAGAELVDGWFTASEIAALRDGRFIDAVKAVRVRTDVGLAQAKDFVVLHGAAYRQNIKEDVDLLVTK